MTNQDDKMSYIDDYFKKNGIYELYHDLCMRMDTVPVSRESLQAIYVDVLDRHEELYAQAISELDNDKKLLLESLEKEEAPIEDLVSVDNLPPSITITVNDMKGAVICLYILFPDKATEPHIIPSYVSEENDTTIFL